jgi:hypothetical protein
MEAFVDFAPIDKFYQIYNEKISMNSESKKAALDLKRLFFILEVVIRIWVFRGFMTPKNTYVAPEKGNASF